MKLQYPSNSSHHHTSSFLLLLQPPFHQPNHPEILPMKIAATASSYHPMHKHMPKFWNELNKLDLENLGSKHG